MKTRKSTHLSRRLLAAALALLITLSLATGITLAAPLGDMEGHWASAAVERWSDMGVVTGYADGNFHPDDHIRRGDVALVLSRLFGYTATAENGFTDLDSDAYYTTAVLQAKAASSMVGSGTTFSPTANLTRQEAAVLLCNLLGLAPADAYTISFADSHLIADWARGSVYALANKGFLSGSGGRVNPRSDISRAEFVTLLNNAISMVVSSGTVRSNVNGTLLITGDDVVLENITIVGDLIVAEGVDEGTLTLKNVSVSGQTIIRGGGEPSIKLEGTSLLSSVRMEKNGASLHIATSAESLIQSLVISGGAETILNGNFGSITVSGAGNVFLTQASVKSMTRSTTGVVSVDGDSYVEQAAITADDVHLVGVGVIGTIAVRGNYAMILTSKSKITVAQGLTGVTVGGEPVSGGATVISPENTEIINDSYTYTETTTTNREPPVVPPTVPTVPQDITVYLTVEAFTIGMNDFILEPTKITVTEGMNTAQVVTDQLTANNYGYGSTGGVNGGFYLSNIQNVFDLPENFNAIALPSCLQDHPTLEIIPKDIPDTKDRFSDSLGEFDYTFMSGWMYSVNNVFPSVGMSEYTLSDGDVIRLQLTLWGYGADIGGGYAAGGFSNYYLVPDLTADIRRAATSGNYGGVLEAAQKIIAD